jgi:hypothetical protein
MKELATYSTLIAALQAEHIEAQKVIGLFAKAGNIPNDWPLTDDSLICQIPYPQCKAASAWMDTYADDSPSGDAPIEKKDDELAQLRVALDEAQKVIEGIKHQNYYAPQADTWLEKWGKK